MGRKVDLVGRKFGRITVIEEAGRKHKSLLWLCRCECGTELVAYGSNLCSGKTKSCGCLRSEMVAENNMKHGLCGIPEYDVWAAMKKRCFNPNDAGYSYYGGRGISVCTDWIEFDGFYADMGKRPSDKHTLERIDNDGSYSPENCVWSSREIQSRNRRVQSNNKTGVAGVRNRGRGYRAFIGVSGEDVYLGQFNDFFEACCARKSAEISLWGDL